MHLDEILAIRSVPLAGISMGLTRRCPLSCAHCSTESTRTSEQHDAAIFLRFVESFTQKDRPELISMSGGEALLRPRLVEKLANKARRVGTRSSVLSGFYFANQEKIPANIEWAIRSLDHFSVSMDIFHEAEVPRDNSFRTLETILDYGIDCSLHLVGTGPEDSYIEDVTNAVKARFGSSLPILVNSLSWFGRARGWMKAPDGTDQQAGPMPCMMAAWPVVSFDGTVLACGNDDAIVRLPDHLVLGHAGKDSWQVIRERSQTSAHLRAIRLYGPEFIKERILGGKASCDGYCETCMKLPSDAQAQETVSEAMAGQNIATMELAVAVMHAKGGGEAFARLHGIPEYSELVQTGRKAGGRS